MSHKNAPGGTPANQSKPVAQAFDKRAYLVMQAEKLLNRGIARFEAQEALVRFVQREKWPAEWQDVATSVVVEVQRREWKAEADARAEAEREELQMVCLADVQPEAVKWLWRGRIPLGKVTVIYGEAGIGKTSLGLELVARVSAGMEWPDEEPNAGQGRVLILNGEDALKDTLCPRLKGAGADLKNVSALGKIQRVVGSQKARRFELGRDLPVLRQRLESLQDVRLVLIDSLELFCGSSGLSKSQMRCTLADLEELAAEFGVSIVILSTGSKCDLAVKNVWRVDCDVLDEKLLYWLPVRFAWPDVMSPGLSFRIERERIVWGDPYETVTNDRLRGVSSKEMKGAQLSQQADWLADFLAEGAQPAKVVLAAASGEGWSASQMRRAREALRVRVSKEQGVHSGWVWELAAPGGEKVELEKVESRSAMAIQDVKGVKDAARVLEVA